jgi:hypothetical protein
MALAMSMRMPSTTSPLFTVLTTPSDRRVSSQLPGALGLSRKA